MSRLHENPGMVIKTMQMPRPRPAGDPDPGEGHRQQRAGRAQVVPGLVRFEPVWVPGTGGRRNAAQLQVDVCSGAPRGSALPLSPATRDRATLAASSGTLCLWGSPRLPGTPCWSRSHGWEWALQTEAVNLGYHEGVAAPFRSYLPCLLLSQDVTFL